MMLLQAPETPIRTRPILVDERTTPARLTARVLAGARRYTLPAALLSVTHQLGEAMVPVIMGFAIERAVSTGDVLAVLPWLAALALDFALLSFSWRFGSRIGELGMLAVQHRLRALVTEYLLRSDAPRPPGLALSLATSDVNRLSYAVEIGVYPVGQLAAVLFGGAVLLTISWPLGLVVLLGAPLLLWLTERAGGGLRRRSDEEQELAAEAAGRAADLMAGYRVIRGIGAEAEAVRRYRSVSRAALGGTLRARGAEGRFTGAMDAVTGLFLTVVSVAAALFAVGGVLSVGELITVVGLTQFLIAPLQSVATDAGTLWASATASAGRLLTLLRTADSAVAPDAAAGVLVDGIAPGEIVTVVAGGATASDLVRRIAVARPEALVAPHASHLFGGSVRENVALDGVAASRALDALIAAGCDDFADGLPHGFDTAVGENGGALSGGQRQRVALARALAQDAAVLVLHEPTTAVDAVTEAAIAERLRPFRGTRRTLVISGSAALAAAADRVVTL